MKRVGMTCVFFVLFAVLASGQQANQPRHQPLKQAEGFTPMPNELNYQGVLTTGSGFPADGIYSLQFDLFYVEAGGASIWTETHGAITVQNGTFNVRLGTLTALPYFVTPYYLEITANSGPGIGAPFTFTPRQKLASAPYALGPWHQHAFSLSAPYYWVAIGTDTPYTTLTLAGPIGFLNGSSSMLYVYQSGVGNPDRMVVSHSPDFPYYGLAYQDGLDYMDFRGALGQAFTVDLDGRRAGVDLAAGAMSDFSAFSSGTHRRYSGFFTTDSQSGTSRALVGMNIGSGNYDAVGVYGQSTPADFWGYGGRFIGGWMGVYGSVSPSGGSNYVGVRGTVSGGTGTNYGIYGLAGNGALNYAVYGTAAIADNHYAGYFNGRLRVSTATGDSAVMFPVNAISSAEILDEPGIAQDLAIATSFLSDAAVMQDIDTIDVTVPGPGYVVVEAQTNSFFRDVTGVNRVFVQIDTVAGGTTIAPYWVRSGLGGYTNTTDYSYIPVHVMRVFQVSGAGTYTYRFEGQEDPQNAALNTCGVYQTQLRATYFPTSYGTVEAAASAAAVTAPGESADGATVDLRTLELRMAQARLAAQEAEIQLLKAQKAQEDAKEQSLRDDQ